MKTRFLLGGALCAGMLLAWGAKDQVIMTVNGVDVPRSEFEYLYHKNSQQQVDPQSLDEYVEMFKNYRLKVADALAEGVDTTAAYRQEMEQYRHELAAPYLADSVYLNQLVQEAYDRSLKELNVGHIMLFKSREAEVNKKNRQLMDSLKTLLDGGEDFATLAARFSQDRGSNSRGGMLGWLPAGRVPYEFESVAYTLKPGEISGVVESPVGYHIIKGGESRPARGKVHVAHIMRMVPADADKATAAAQKALADSIYQVVKADPNKFEAMAVEYSEDPGSARQGGLLRWFGAGEMVQEFDSVAFAIPVGAVSEPFRTNFGWHIIRKFEEKGVPSLEEMKPMELKKIENPRDARHQLLRDNQTKKLAAKYKAALDDAAINEMRLGLVMNGLDSAYYESYSSQAARNREIGHIGKTSLTAGQLIDSFHGGLQDDPAAAERYFDEAVDNFFNRQLVAVEEQTLEKENADYRNLLHEYQNGSLLYEVSVRKVWDRASKDTEGLEKYFNDHRADYAWKEPRAKGILVQAANDSIAGVIAERYAKEGPSAMSALSREFRGKMAAERVLATKGQNAMVDNLLFGGPAVKPSNSAYTVYFILDGHVIDAPEEVADVRGQVTSDYQTQLENEWIAELRQKYPIKVNEKVLKKIK